MNILEIANAHGITIDDVPPDEEPEEVIEYERKVEQNTNRAD